MRLYSFSVHSDIHIAHHSSCRMRFHPPECLSVHEADLSVEMVILAKIVLFFFYPEPTMVKIILAHIVMMGRSKHN